MAPRACQLLPLLTFPALAVAQPIHGSQIDSRTMPSIEGASLLRLDSVGPTRLRLTEGSFSSIVESDSMVQEWVVFFCKDTLPECRELQRTFRAFSEDFDRQINAGRLLAPSVAFAEVDCREERLLCSRQGVENYPSVGHYVRGVRPKMLSLSSGSELTLELVGQASKALAKWLRASVGVARPLPAPALPESGPFRLACALGSWAAASLWALINFWQFLARKPSVVQQGTRAAAESPRAASSLLRRLPSEWAAQRDRVEL